MSSNSGIIEQGDKLSLKKVETPYRKTDFSSLRPQGRDRAPHIPVLLQATLQFSWAIVLALGLMTAIVSFASGCNGMTILIRAGASVLVSGIILWIFTYFVVQGTVEIAQKYLDDEAKEIETKAKEIEEKANELKNKNLEENK
jgi:hypothetical protein